MHCSLHECTSLRAFIYLLQIWLGFIVTLQLTCYLIFSNDDIEVKEERTPLKFKPQTTALDSPPVKKTCKQKSRRILDDASDEENNKEDFSPAKHSEHVDILKQNTVLQEENTKTEHCEVGDNKEESKFIEVMSPQNERMRIPKRKTGLQMTV